MAEIFVLGSINQDFVLKVERRPQPGETVTDAELSTGSGGKGANQAAAAALLGASVTFLGRVGADEFGEPLVRALGEKGIDTTLVKRVSGESTGAAFITVRSEEHTSELQSRQYLVCRLLLEKKKNNRY